MDWLDRYGLFLFDFDGLLVNTEHLHQKAYETLAEEIGCSVDWDFSAYCSLAHRRSRGPLEYFYDHFPRLKESHPDPDALYERKCVLYQALLEEGQTALMPGAGELLERLAQADIPRAVVTHGRRVHIDLIRGQLSLLNTIPHWITREDYTHAKPHPEGYLTAITQYGQHTDQVVGFEDTSRGLAALCQTPAQPVLVCPPDYPLLEEAMTPSVVHLTSLSEVVQSSTSR